jgi:hypothetical protein
MLPRLRVRKRKMYTAMNTMMPRAKEIADA